MTAPLDSEAKVRITAHLPVSSQKSVNFEPAGYSLINSLKRRRAFFLVLLQANSAARAPKNHGPSSRRPRPSAESAPLSQPLYCLSTRPTSPPYPSPQLISPPSPPPSPDPLACDLQLASVAVSAARRDTPLRWPGYPPH
jgi:hypothetical protein